jgi:hypothetical protein
VPSDHLGKVLRQRIDLLLEEEKGGSNGTQLPFINNKGEFVHLIINASKDKLQRRHSLRQKQGKSIIAASSTGGVMVRSRGVEIGLTTALRLVEGSVVGARA